MFFDFLTIVVIVNALATFVLWSERRPEKIKKKFRKQLFDTKPITPKNRGDHENYQTTSTGRPTTVGSSRFQMIRTSRMRWRETLVV